MKWKNVPPWKLAQRLAGEIEPVVPQVVTVWSLIRHTGEHARVAALSALIVAAVVANAVVQVELNAWNRPFYDALEQRNLTAFIDQILVFALLAGILLVLVVAQTWMLEMLKISLRRGLTASILDQWLKSNLPYRVGLFGEIGVNPDQRIQEDIRRLTELSADLAVGALQATLLFGTFVGVLWALSADVVFRTAEGPFTVPGYMVWCALAYAVLGSWMSWRVGRPLVRLNAERYGREASFRSAIVRVNESAEGIALNNAEGEERLRLGRELDRVCEVMRDLAYGLARLTWVTSSYGWIAIVAPIIVAAPGYFGGSLSFGGLMMVVNAFYQVQQALRWFVDNFARIADWRAALARVMFFEAGVRDVEEKDPEEERITIAEHHQESVRIDRLEVFFADGRAALAEPEVEIGAGEHVLIVGEPGSGKSTFFRALAGLWPWGRGTVTLPPRDEIMFMPQRPYLVPGTLRRTLTSPADPAAFGDDDLSAALRRTGLGHLVESLDRTERWDRELPLDEQQRLAVARLLLHKPKWVFLDEAISAIDDERRRLILSVFQQELAGTAVISTSRSSADDSFYGRVLRIVRHRQLD